MFFNFKSLRRAAAFSCLALVLNATDAQAQKDSAPAQNGEAAAAAPAQAKPWSVTMSKSAPHTFTVKATDAKLSDIAAEISRLTKVPVTLSSLMQKQRVSLDFGGLNLDATLRMLAPQPVVDYESGRRRPAAARARRIPSGLERDAARARPGDARRSQAILIEGNTEEGTESEAKKEQEDPLKVTYSNSHLSVRAKKQPLSVVLFKIANELGIPFDLRYESPQARQRGVRRPADRSGGQESLPGSPVLLPAGLADVPDTAAPSGARVARGREIVGAFFSPI